MIENFSFGLDDQDVIDAADLSNTERAMLRQLAENGGPIAKVMIGLKQHQEIIERELLELDLDTELGLQRAKALRIARSGIIFHRQLWENILTDRPEKRDERREPDQPNLL